MSLQKYDTPIDPYSEYSLHDVVAGDVPMAESTEYVGFHVMSQGDGKFSVGYDGHLGVVMEFEADDYDDVLELVDDLNGLVVYHHELEYQDDDEELIEWAGRYMTSDQERADEKPEKFVYVPGPGDDDEFTDVWE